MQYRRREDNYVFWQDKFTRCSLDIPGECSRLSWQLLLLLMEQSYKTASGAHCYGAFPSAVALFCNAVHHQCILGLMACNCVGLAWLPHLVLALYAATNSQYKHSILYLQ